MKKNEFKIKVIEKPIVNFNDVHKLNESELSVIKGGTDEDDELELQKKCLFWSRFIINDWCVCDKRTFIGSGYEEILD
ncbi:MAG: hypothetical protein LBE11_00535 [Prevotellaceae bacterium]|jgi:hypothetical protein|nr:hypothetical protein [Prevotellaceae bacterium]